MRCHRLTALLLFLIVLALMPGTLSAQEGTEEVTQEVAPSATPTMTFTAVATATATVTLTPPPATGETFYVVQPGDNLFRIALRFRTTVQALAQANGIVNPSLIYAGQRIRIPGAVQPSTPTPVPLPTATGGAATPATGTAPAPTATPISTGTIVYIVQRGDTLARIAIRNNTTVARLVALNNIVNPNLIYTGQRLLIPAPGVGQGGGPVSTAAPTTAATQVSIAPQGFGFDYGVEASLIGQEADLASQIASLGFRWVKHEVRWRDLEPNEGQMDFSSLDSVVDALDAQNLNILFTVTSAPGWARTSQEENGPPDDFADFARFVSALAGRYAGRVQAYEIWSEPNLRREWNSTAHPISATSYLELLRQGYNAVKTADPAAVVVSAGLAPTGFNDGVNAINDRLFLRSLYAAGLAGLSDAIGAHPGGWANPPDATCCAAPSGVTTHYEDRSFYFLDTLNDYRQIMVQNNDGNTAIWVTEFGWGTSEDTDPPSQTFVFVTYTSLEEQAAYIPRAFELGAELGFVGPMFLYNLNGCEPGSYFSSEACFFSLIGPDDTPRPALGAVESLDKTGSAPPAPVSPTATLIFAPTFTPIAEGATPVSAASPTTEATQDTTGAGTLPTDKPADTGAQPAATEEAGP
jgi:LysM repeat protein